MEHAETPKPKTPKRDFDIMTDIECENMKLKICRLQEQVAEHESACDGISVTSTLPDGLLGEKGLRGRQMMRGKKSLATVSYYSKMVAPYGHDHDDRCLLEVELFINCGTPEHVKTLLSPLLSSFGPAKITYFRLFIDSSHPWWNMRWKDLDDESGDKAEDKSEDQYNSVLGHFGFYMHDHDDGYGNITYVRPVECAMDGIHPDSVEWSPFE
jgi:hypothetical protein